MVCECVPRFSSWVGRVSHQNVPAIQDGRQRSSGHQADSAEDLRVSGWQHVSAICNLRSTACRIDGLQLPACVMRRYIVRLSTDAAGVDEFCEQRAAAERPCRQKFKVVLLGCSVEVSALLQHIREPDPQLCPNACCAICNAYCMLQLTEEEVAELRVDRRIYSIDTNDGVRPYQSPPFVPPHQRPPPPLQQSPPTPAPPSVEGPNVEARAPWNLNRISHPSLPVTASYTWASDGSNVNVYVLDTVWCCWNIAQPDTALLGVMQCCCSVPLDQLCL